MTTCSMLHNTSARTDVFQGSIYKMIQSIKITLRGKTY